jgi:pimeloyl-ACP methyl ester carboxylesterase/membrane protein DedA with SNARE-associated domain
MKSRINKGIRQVKHRWLIFFVVYITLLSGSQVFRHYYPFQATPAAEQKTVLVKASQTTEPNSSDAAIAYFDRKAQISDNPRIILLLHGNPLAAESTFEPMLSLLNSTGRVIAPDLPGFGASTRSIADYSIRSHAAYTLDFLDRLNIPSVHIVAYSMGGGVALSMAAMAPERVRSITMLSAVGVQEFELLGNYTINRALHGTQLALIWLLTNGFPHMSLLDRIPLNLSYARNFYDTDQRPLRGYLNQYQTPMLIIHGRRDALVPLAAALEHHRLVPQSELKLYDGGHLMLFSHPEVLAGDIGEFISRVEQNRAASRPRADAIRLAQAAKPLRDVHVPPVSGLALIILMLLIALATLVSEDLTCIGAGLMAARGTIGLAPAVIASFAGILIGDILLYLAGKYLGRPALNYPPLKWMIKNADVTRMSRWFSAKGPTIIISSRFLPGSRLPTYFSAGVLGTGFWFFTFYFTIAAALWTPLLVGLSALIGSRMFDYYDLFRQYGVLILLTTVLMLWMVVKLIIPLFTFRGRRLLLSAVRRKIRWEFWPTYILYLPVIVYFLYLSARFRSLTLFTASNPGIPEGGFMGEPNAQILDNIKDNEGFIARYRMLPANGSPADRIKVARAFIQDVDATFPIVLKQATGHRGAGAGIIKSQKQLETHLKDNEKDFIIQEYVDGYEYRILYYRYPGQNKGHFFSITEKQLLKLTGDGKSTLEELILKDDCAVSLARLHMQANQDRLFQVPEDGEEIWLADVGVRKHGALFFDGRHVCTPELEAIIDKISKSFNGFYFGRYGIRTPSRQDFKMGKNFKVIELTGVTSKATHIYSPGNNLWQFYRVLMQQWKIAYEIGAINRDRGFEPVSLKKMLQIVTGLLL